MRLALIALLLPTPAYACKCRAPALDQAAKDAALVFSGTIDKVIVGKQCRDGSPTDCWETYKYELVVDRVWKGAPGARITLDTGSGTGDCTKGELGPKGEAWILTIGADHAVRSCDGSQRSSADAVARVTKALGAPHKP